MSLEQGPYILIFNFLFFEVYAVVSWSDHIQF